MCVIFLAYKVHPEFPLLVLANRDEFYNRPSAPAAVWPDIPEIFAPRDLVGGGTWIGCASRGRFAAVTNFREPGAPQGSRSRGELVAGFLGSDSDPRRYMEEVSTNASEFSGFNLLCGDVDNGLFWFSNRGGAAVELTPGIYGLSNHLLDSPWPKVLKGKEFLKKLVNAQFDREACFAMLADETRAPDDELPSTGVGLELERILSPVFVRTDGYGTRSSTILTLDGTGRFNLDERILNNSAEEDF